MATPYTEVLVFACNWDGWSCIETATNLGLHYPASVKVVKVSCLSRIHAGLILKAFEFGADGVMLLGCEPGRCRFGADMSEAHEKRWGQQVNNSNSLAEGKSGESIEIPLLKANLPKVNGNSKEFAAKRQNIISEYEKTRSILEMLGMWKDRLVLVQLAAFDGREYVTRVKNLIAGIEQIAASKHDRIIGSVPTQDSKVPSHS
jgi:coenzyme F420-reducing hydrogenase delta subunit